MYTYEIEKGKVLLKRDDQEIETFYFWGNPLEIKEKLNEIFPSQKKPELEKILENL